MLTDLAKPPAPAPAVDDLRARLRLPAGFDDDAILSPRLAGLVSLAIQVVEERTGHALLRRRFTLRDGARLSDGALPLPRRPVAAVETVTVERESGGAEALAPAGWRLGESRGAPALRLSVVPPSDAFLEVTFEAGHADDWAGAPEDLRQAVVEIAAGYYEATGQTAAQPLSPTATLLLAPYRRVRL